MKVINIILILCICLISSCETEVTNFKTENINKDIVVYGELTNGNKPCSIRITYTNDYNPYDISQFAGKPVKKAEVKIIDNAGNSFKLDEISDGFYRTGVDFKTETNLSYQLKIKTSDGFEIESTMDKLKPAPALKEFSYKYIEAEKVENMRFDLKASIKDNGETNDYYFIKRQDFIQFLTTCKDPPPPPAPVPPCFTKCWRAPQNTQPILINDFLINGKDIPFELKPINVHDFTEWIIQLDVFSVSKETFEYWKRQEDQRLIGGGLFDKIPAQIIGNLRCTNKPEQQILGVFVVSGILKQRLSVDRFNAIPLNDFIKVQAYADFNDIRFKNLKLDDCRQAAFVEYNIGFSIPEL